MVHLLVQEEFTAMVTKWLDMVQTLLIPTHGKRHHMHTSIVKV